VILRPLSGVMMVLLALSSHALFAQEDPAALGCGTLQNAYGPFDYRTDKGRLGIVEKFHFGPGQETLSNKVGLGGNIDYTLRAFPNHHRALMSMMKLGFRERTSKPKGADYTIKCYMVRAEAFRPDDAMVKVIHGLYLIQSGAAQEAVAKFEQARELDSNNANVHYNLGLAYFDLKKYELALESAHVAYAQGFPLMGLRDKLKRAGKWRDPVAGRAGPVAPDLPSAPAEIVPEIESPDKGTPESASES